MDPALSSVTRRVLPALGVGITCTAAGWALTDRGPAAFVLLGVSAAAVVLLVFSELRLAALWLWPPLSVIGYPLSGLLPTSLLSFDRVWICAMAILLILLPAARRPARASRMFQAALVVFALVVGLRAALTSPDTLLALKTWVNALLLPLILFAVVRRAIAQDRGLTERLALTMMIAGVLLAVIGIGERIFGYNLASLQGEQVRFDEAIGTVRISGPYDAPEPYGLTLVICLAATLYWTQMRGAGVYLLGGTVVALQGVAIALTFFRVAWIATVVVVVLALGLRPGRHARLIGATLLTLLILALAFTQLQRVSAFETRVRNTENAASRLASYKQAVEIFEREPVYGVGFTRYGDIAEGLPSTVVAGIRSQPAPHSSFFGILAEVGLLGAAALAWLVVAAVRLVRRFNRAARLRRNVLFGPAVTGAALAYLLFSLTLTMLPYGPPNMFLALLLGAAAGRLDGLNESPAPAPEAKPLPAFGPRASREPTIVGA